MLSGTFFFVIYLPTPTACSASPHLHAEYARRPISVSCNILQILFLLPCLAVPSFLFMFFKCSTSSISSLRPALPVWLAKNRRRELLQAGADPNAATAAGETPLELAELSGSFYVVRELLLAGAEPLAPAAAIPRGDEAGVAAAYSNADAAYGDYDDDEDTEGSWR